jgi:hypothetical protein
MLRRAAAVMAAAGAAVLALAAPALADGGGGWVACSGTGCTLLARQPGTRRPAGPGRPRAAGGGAGLIAGPGCAGGAPVRVTPGRDESCTTLDRPGAAAAPPPAVLARIAESGLGLGSPVIRASPAVGGDQLVNVPTWLWLAGPWAPVTATAAVPGEAVTATATPQKVTWETGDGSAVTCAGPGTPYRAGGNPDVVSPTCGHTYTATSAAAPGGKFTVTAAITWTVAWSGAGAGGAFAGLVTTSAVRVAVAQSQAIVTGAGS